MIEFINLNEQDTEAVLNYKHSLYNTIPTTLDTNDASYGIISIEKIELPSVDETLEPICVKDDCDASTYYGCTNGTNGFQKENLFSELTDEYQRAVARINLGITDEYAMKWGNIKGNLSDQKDLYTFVTDSIAFEINKVIDNINLKLAQWAYEIQERLESKADVFSPNFKGTPTTTLPLLTDSSNRIPTTEWVSTLISESALGANIKIMGIDPSFMYYGDDPVTITVEWDYKNTILGQSVNDIPLDISTRKYIFTDITSSLPITLKNRYIDRENIESTESRTITFIAKYPIYYGTSRDYTLLDKTVEDTFTTTTLAGEYIYVFIPNGKNTSLLVGSIIGGFILLGTQSIHNNIYYVFKSINAGLGKTIIQVATQGYFENVSMDQLTLIELLATKADISYSYSKRQIDIKLDAIQSGDIDLENYFTKEQVINLLPDISSKADKTEIPTLISQLANDVKYLTSVPIEYITVSELDNRGYLTEEKEPLFMSSSARSIIKSDIDNWNNKVSKIPGMGLSEENFTPDDKYKLSSLGNYDDTYVRNYLITLNTKVEEKADRVEIPDISGKADISLIPTKVSQLLNDNNYINTLPQDIVTTSILDSRGYLTSFTEIDPTVPEWAKQPMKPIYTLEELGAEASGSADAMYINSVTYTNDSIAYLLNSAEYPYNTLGGIGREMVKHGEQLYTLTSNVSTINTTLLSKANKSELFSGNYTDLTGIPVLPDFSTLATISYVDTSIANIPSLDLSVYALKTEIPNITGKVDKIDGLGLSQNSYTNPEKTKLAGLYNYNDYAITQNIEGIKDTIEGLQVVIPYELYSAESYTDYFEGFDQALSFVNKLSRASSVYIQYTRDKTLTPYSKGVINTTDVNNVHTIVVILIVHFSADKDLRVTFTLVDDISDTFTISKEFVEILSNDITLGRPNVPLSEAQGKLLSDRLTSLEELVNNTLVVSSIILE